MLSKKIKVIEICGVGKGTRGVKCYLLMTLEIVKDSQEEVVVFEVVLEASIGLMAVQDKKVISLLGEYGVFREPVFDKSF